MKVHEILHHLQLEQQIKKQLKQIQQKEKKTFGSVGSLVLMNK